MKSSKLKCGKGFRRKFRDGERIASTIYLLPFHNTKAQYAADRQKISKAKLLTILLEKALA